MTIVSINSCNFGSTGNIMLQITETARKKGYKAYSCCPYSRDNNKRIDYQIYIGNRISRNIHLKLSELTGLNGCFSIVSTMMFIRKLKKIKPNIIHLHNLHNCYLNLPMFFNYIKKNNINVVWTLHDCWAFTGRCPHFQISRCNKWSIGCESCGYPKRDYPRTIINNEKWMWKHKKKWFSNVKSMIIVTPSKWLAGLVKNSYLGNYPVSVINNGIDLNVFKPTYSDFILKYNLKNKYILLGVALGWDYRKGLDVFIELSHRLDDRFQIVLVGTNNNVDNFLPKNIISIHRTSSQRELAEIYSSTDLFVNPTREENYPTVNMEAIACGTPVITFKTGGSPEIVDEKTGYVVDVDDIDEMEKQIIRICTEKTILSEDCIMKAKSFDKIIKYKQYLDLYDYYLHERN